MKLKFLLFGILFMCAGLTGFAQEQFTVKSKVLDDRKEPLPGVRVLEVGTQNGTTTNPLKQLARKATGVIITQTGSERRV